jgi:hypothetical protein
MKDIIKTLSFILVLSNLYGQAISVEPSSIRFNGNLSLTTYSPTISSLQNSLAFNSNSSTPPIMLNFSVQGVTFGTITKNLSDNFNFLGNDGFMFETYNASNYVSALKINKNGNVGVGTTSPTTKLEVNGFSKLGSDAPAIKIKKLTTGCTTSANSGFPSGEISLTHGITPSKILKVEALVEYATNFWVKDGNDLFGYEFDIYITNTTISLRNLSGSASSEIRSKPCKILITYEE